MKISYYSIAEVWVISFVTVAIFLLSLLPFTFENQIIKHPPSGSSLAFEIEGKIKDSGFYTYSAAITIGDALKRAGALNESFIIPSPEFLSIPLVSGSQITVADGIKVGYMEAEKFILFFIPFDVNQVTFNQLKTIPGIGEKLSQDILDYRANFGCFKTIEDLKNVSGIGDVKFKKIKHYFSISSNGG